MSYSRTPHSDVLVHHGVKGMHWGVRRAEKKQQRVAGRVAKGEHLVKEATKAGVKNPAAAIALRGAGEVGVILFSGSRIANGLITNQNARNGAHVAKLLLAGTVGTKRVGQLRAVNAYNKSQRGG